MSTLSGWVSVTVAVLLIISLMSTAKGLHPIILVPGDGGSQLDAKLDKPSVVHYLCTKKTEDFFNIWLNMELLVPLIIDCFIDNIRLVYNRTTRATENSPGVEIRVPGFGNTSTVEFLDPSKASPGLYFKFIVEQSLIPLGYTRDNDIRGAPYDFRKAPNEMDDWMRDFKNLIEDSYARGGNNSVILISHSMGGPIALYFLNQMNQTWKDQYVRSVITLAAPWGGSVKAWKVFAAGDDLGVYVLPSHTLRGMQRTSPSTAFLLPSRLFWHDDQIIVSCEGKGNYTVRDLGKFFHDMDYPVGADMYEDTRFLIDKLEAPGVEIHCLHGKGVSTVEGLLYKEEKYFPDSPTSIMGNGDGTVNLKSLQGCLLWSNSTEDEGKFMTKKRRKVLRLRRRKENKQRGVLELIEQNENNWVNGKPVFHEEYSGVDHMQILKDQRVIDYVTQAVKRINGPHTH